MKCERATDTSMRASPAGSRSILGPRQLDAPDRHVAAARAQLRASPRAEAAAAPAAPARAAPRACAISRLVPDADTTANPRAPQARGRARPAKRPRGPGARALIDLGPAGATPMTEAVSTSLIPLEIAPGQLAAWRTSPHGRPSPTPSSSRSTCWRPPRAPARPPRTCSSWRAARAGSPACRSGVAARLGSGRCAAGATSTASWTRRWSTATPSARRSSGSWVRRRSVTGCSCWSASPSTGSVGARAGQLLRTGQPRPRPGAPLRARDRQPRSGAARLRAARASAARAARKLRGP